MSIVTLRSVSEDVWDERAATALSDRLAVLAGQLNVINAQVTDAIAEALERGLWQQGAVRTPEQFVAWQLGVRHHKLHHQGKLGITGNADEEHGLTFTDCSGKAIGPNGQPIPPTESPPEAPQPYTPPLRGRIRRQGEWVHPNVLRRRAEAARRVNRPTRAA